MAQLPLFTRWNDLVIPQLVKLLHIHENSNAAVKLGYHILPFEPLEA